MGLSFLLSALSLGPFALLSGIRYYFDQKIGVSGGNSSSLFWRKRRKSNLDIMKKGSQCDMLLLKQYGWKGEKHQELTY